ncbi:MAG: hypothetical protein MUO72_19275 [Bacteroidales bacterium]|nr:hypothetical protein [Bacteroidales bacterium]
MRNRLFAVPVVESETGYKNKSDDLGTLKNKSSGKRLFKYNYFNLLIGDFSVLITNKNKWFLEEILLAGSNGDINIIPALKKIASDSNFDEGVRQKSSEIIEILGADNNISKTKVKLSAFQQDEKKLIDAKKALAGIRIPQTTEILRLLKEKSIESKRLAIFMIGKFKFIDMLPEVCECLNIPGLEEDTVAVLRILGSDADDELRRFYLKASGNINTSKTILRFLSSNNTKENITFIFERLWSNSRQIKEIALNCLTDCSFKAPEEDKNRLYQLIYEVISSLTFLISAKISIRKNKNEFLYQAVDKDYKRWKLFFARLLSITFTTNNIEGSIPGKSNNLQLMEANSFKSIPEIVDIIFSKPKKPFEDYKFEEKRIKKLQRFFPKEISDYHEVIEDLINHDYNLISVWTKACTLRSLQEITDESLTDSVIALLFSPETILQEEAVNLVARSGRELYKSAFQRIPEQNRLKLDKIITGETDEKELLFEKIKFLSFIFPGIPEDDLLILAGSMKYIKIKPGESLQLADGSVIWTHLPGKADPEVVVLTDGNLDKSDGKRFSGENISFYVLKMEAVEAFNHNFPERAFEIMKYIDENEE